MITSVNIKNFKNIKSQTYEFTNFDLLIGRNNSGKSTILQAMAIWQYCIDEFRRLKRKGSTGVQVVLPNFTALPLPEFNLLWKDKTERKYTSGSAKKKKQEYIYIEIRVSWKSSTNKDDSFGVKLRYQSPQSIYAIPSDGWKIFKELDQQNRFPRIVYVPPFSGLEPFEKWVDDSIIKQQVGKAQPGSVLRNLLYHIVEKSNAIENNEFWEEVKQHVSKLFSVELKQPKYEKGVDTHILCEYKVPSGKTYDIISGGSGFHQTLTILAFIYGYSEKISTILFDEPDAHMHTNLQREIIQYFKHIGRIKGLQFIIATHAEEFIRRVDALSIVSLLQKTIEQTVPNRIDSSTDVLTALSEISNNEITLALQSPFILYGEGETDFTILSQWAKITNKSDVYNRFITITMKGGSKKEKKEFADRHFRGIKQIIPQIDRVMIFDYDSENEAFHPDANNRVLFEWKRKNIENYLLVPEAWVRAARFVLGYDEASLFMQPIESAIYNFFQNENLTLPPNADWVDLNANIFKVVDGKVLLFESENSLFQIIKAENKRLIINRELISSSMTVKEIHKDILNLFEKLSLITGED